MIDFSQLAKKHSQNQRIHPREIFMSLGKKHKDFSYPRDVQTDVWNKWFERRDTKNCVIKMNTGSGKTVVALLMLQSCLNEKKGNAVYVVPDNNLVAQVCRQAALIGINAVTSENDMDFKQNNAILVINISKLVNGKSIFGMREYGNIVIDNIVIDDVHACIGAIEDQFVIKIPVDSKEYKSLLRIFEKDLTAYNANQYADILEKGRSKMQIPFWFWQAKSDAVLHVLRKSESEEILFKLPLLADTIRLSRAFLTSNEITVVPFSVDIDQIVSLRDAKRRMFFSATLPDDSVFTSVLNIMPEEIGTIITPPNADDIGDRMILFPQVINPNITDNEIKQFVQTMSKKLNVFVLVPSFYRADWWSDIATEVLCRENITKGIEKAKESKHGLYILVNKYDGIDLPDDLCRLLIIDRLPAIYNEYDIFENLALNGSDRLISELVQKIEQGMGRGVRSNADYCGVILMGSQLSDLILSKGMDCFSTATKKQIELASTVWAEQKGQTLDEITKVLEPFYSRDDGWVKFSREALAELRYETEVHINQTIVATRIAYNYALIRQYKKAQQELENLLPTIEYNSRKGFIKQLIAEYSNFTNSLEAQEILLSAMKLNRNILKPLEGIEIDKIQVANLNSVDNLLEFIRANSFTLNSFLLRAHSICEKLSFGDVPSEEFEDAVYQLGCLLGFDSKRPEKIYNIGPDNLWIQSAAYVIECKNNAVSDTISKTDSGQLLSSTNWAHDHALSTSIEIVPIMIHRSRKFDKAASPQNGTRIIDEEALERIKTNLINFAKSMNSPEVFSNREKISNLLTHFGFTSGEFIQRYTKDFRKG